MTLLFGGALRVLAALALLVATETLAQETRASRDARAANRRDPRRVDGIVYDSLARAPLPGAFVQLVPLGDADADAGRRSTTSDTAGRFAFDSVSRGTYAIGFFHPKLDSLGIDAPLVRLELRDAPAAAAELAVPSAMTVVEAACGHRAARDSTGIIVGYVRDATTARPLERATIRAQWSEILIDRKGTRARAQEASARCR